ncbi:MAG: DUF2961 domain-containing protein [Fibrobacteres bacterium]|nr:DUF2961 domain-containing protein [Fibrobacterota bacterium]
MGKTIIVILWAFCTTVWAEYGVNAGFDAMGAPERVPFFFENGTVTKQFISYDPTGNNSDWLGWPRYKDKNGEYVIFEDKGSGCLYRQQMNIWQSTMDPVNTRIRYYFDGETVPKIDMTLNEYWGYHQNYTAPFTPSLSYFDDLQGKYKDRMGVNYFPLPFKKGLKVTLTRTPSGYGWYQYTYLRFADTAKVKTWDGTDTASGKVRAQWASIGQDPKPTAGNQTFSKTSSLQKDSSVVIFTDNAKGSIASVKLTVNPYTIETFYNVYIKITWDNQSTPAVDLPLAYFFGAGGMNDPFRNEIFNTPRHSLFMGCDTGSHSYYSFWPMPYWTAAKIELYNKTANTITINSEIQYKSAAVFDYESHNKSGYFHAKRTETGLNGLPYLAVFQDTGRGKVLAISVFYRGFSCDGDEFTYIDGSKTAQIHGDGSEDDHNMSWGGDKYDKPLWGSWTQYGEHSGVQRDFRIYYNESYCYNRSIAINYERSYLGGTSTPIADATVFYYKNIEKNLALVDKIEIGDTLSEKSHSYTINGQTRSERLMSNYDGYEGQKNVFPVDDNGRSFKGYSQFKVKIGSNHTGIKLRKRVDRYKNGVQEADVYIDGQKITEYPWYVCDLSTCSIDQRFIDSDFEIPHAYTDGKDSIVVKIVYVNSTDTVNGINEFRYLIYAYGYGLADLVTDSEAEPPLVQVKPPVLYDDFATSALDSNWTWIREDTANWQIVNGQMVMTLQGQELWGSNSKTENILLSSPPAKDWSISTKLHFNPTVTYQQAGLIVYLNDDTYLKFIRFRATDGNKIGFDNISSGTYTAHQFAFTDTVVQLKITKSGTTITAFSSINNGVNWTQVYQYTDINLGSTYQVGLIAQNTAGTKAYFDWYNGESTGSTDIAMNEVSKNEISLSVMPNPFNPVTRFIVTLPCDVKKANLSLFSVQGKLLQQWYIDNTVPRHEFEWNGGSSCSGISLLRLTADGKSVSRYITMLK